MYTHSTVCLSKLKIRSYSAYHVNFALIRYCARQAAAFDVQFNFYILLLNDKLSCQCVAKYKHRDQMSK